MKYLYLVFLAIFNFANAADQLFYPYKTNYYLFDNRDVIQFSFKVRLLAIRHNGSELEKSEGLFFAYTQHSYWRQGTGSTGNDNPYIYSNFSPELHYVYKFHQPIWNMTYFQGGVEHQSDGLGRQFDSIHREWNRAYILSTFSFYDHSLLVRAKLWYPDINPRYNPDIAKYMGYSEITFSTNVLKNYWMPRMEISFTKGSQIFVSDLNFRFQNTIRIPKKYIFDIDTPLALFMQWYRGYGEALENYNRRTNDFRLGLTFIL